MNEAEIVKIVTKVVADNTPNNYLGFIVLGALYAIKELWAKLNEKKVDPDAEAHRDETRKRIAHIEDRQSTIMESVEDIRGTLKYIEKEIDRITKKE